MKTFKKENLREVKLEDGYRFRYEGNVYEVKRMCIGAPCKACAFFDDEATCGACNCYVASKRESYMYNKITED